MENRAPVPRTVSVVSSGKAASASSNRKKSAGRAEVAAGVGVGMKEG